MKFIKKGYILPTTIFVITLISAFLMLTLIWVIFYLNRSNKNTNEVISSNKKFKILDSIITEFSSDINEDITSPYNGWFSYLPNEKEGYSIKYYAEDSKFDINHIDFSQLGNNNFFAKDQTDDKKQDKYFYYIWEILPNLKKEYREKYEDIFTIYSVPNLNVSKVEKIKMFMDSQSIPENISKSIIEKINYYRGSRDYLKELKLLIDKDKYLDLRTYFPKDEYDRFFALFDYQGTVNLNFVTKEVFELGMKLCNPPKKDVSSDINDFWKQISKNHESNITIENINIIFVKQGENKDEYKKYSKFFSVDSSMFRVVISKDGNEMMVILRKYKDFLDRTKIEVFKTTVSNKEFKIPDQDLSGDLIRN